MDGFLSAAALLPATLRVAAERLTDGDKSRCEELRLRRGRAATALIAGREMCFSAPPVTEDDIDAVLETATRASLHAVMDQLSRGYISAAGGVRVGVCGTSVSDGGLTRGLRSFSSLSIRVPRAVIGCADGIWSQVTEGGFQSLLIISPPGVGKTTLLRELIRRLSDSGLRLSVADSRGEIADAAGGYPRFDVGAATDVMTGVRKPQAVKMLLRAMNPQVIAMDEITDPEDSLALLDAVGCGVRILATVHGTDSGEVFSRPACRGLLKAGVFARWISVENHGGTRRYAVHSL